MSRLRKLWLRPLARIMLMSWLLLTVAMVATSVRAWAASPQQDPSGSIVGSATDVMNGAGTTLSSGQIQSLDKMNPSMSTVLDAIGQNRLAINIAWTLVTGYLVMFMQAGFAMVETGFCRAKNAAHVMMTNFMIYPIGMLGYWIAGFAIMFGTVAASKIGGPAALGGTPVLNGHELGIGTFGIIGTKGFFLSGTYDVAVYALFLFQMVFMDTTATIPTGAMAERWRFSAFIVYGFFVSIIAYPIYGHLVWGGGGLATMGIFYHLGHGAVDFAGSGVVHAVGGFVALAGAMVLGPRIGKYNKDGKPNAIPGHDLPMALIGTFILAFGWFGFNPGSTLGAAGGGNLRIGVIATNTMLASAGGAFAALLFWKMRFGKYDPSMSANGMLAGLVAITAPCAFVTSWAAVVIGLIAGGLVCASVLFIEKRGVDDPVGAVSVHGVCGIWGVLSVGLFADGTFGAGWNGVGAASYLGVAGRGVTGLFYGDPSQLIAQIIDAAVCILWSFGSAYIFFSLQKKFMRIRVHPEEEMAGLDMPEMGAYAYPDFQLVDARIAGALAGSSGGSGVAASSPSSRQPSNAG